MGFANQLVIAKNFGTSNQLDIYLFIVSLINFLGFYSFPLRDAVSPIFYRELACIEDASRLASSAISTCFYIALAELLIFFIAVFIFRLDSLSSYISSTPTAIQFFLWLIPSLLFITVVEIVSGLLLSLNLQIEQALCRFILPAMTLLSLLFLSSLLRELSLAVSFTIANFLVLLTSIFFLNRANIKIRLTSPKYLIRPGIKNMFLTMMLVYVFAQIHALFERSVLLQFGPGVISGFQYAFMLVTTLIGVISGPICNLLWPFFMEIDNSDHGHKQGQLLDSLWVYLGFPLIIIAVFVFNNAQTIIHFIFFRGNFNTQSVDISASALMFLIFAIVPACISQVIVRLYNAKNNFLGIGFIGISMALSGIALLTISLFQHNLKLAMSQWFIANAIGALICVVSAYWYLGLKEFFTSARITLFIKIGMLIFLAFLITQVPMNTSKLILGINLVKFFLVYTIPLLIGLVILNRSYFPFLQTALFKD